MKQIFSKTLMCAGMAATLLTGCMENDLYNAEAVREKAEKAFGIAIDPNQDWNMIETVKANISIKEDALSNYKFKVYTANPLSTESGATLLAEKSVSTDAKGNANADLTFDMPSYMEYVYVARVDDHGRRLVKSAKVNNGTLNAEFGGNAVGTRGADDTYPVPPYESPYADEAAIEAAIEGGKVYENNISSYGSAAKEVFRITGTVNGLPYYGGWASTKEAYIIIEDGGVINTQFNSVGMDPLEKYDIIVKNGGTLNLTGSTSQDHLDNARLIIMSGGNVTGTTIQSGPGTLDKERGNIYNAGTIDVKDINLANANLYNKGTLKADCINASSGGTIINNGKIECKEIGKDLSRNNGGLDIQTYCLFRCTEYLKCRSITLGSLSAIEAPEIAIYGDVYLNRDCVIRAEIGHMGNTQIHAPKDINKMDDYPLISFPTLMYFTNNDGTSATIEGQLFIEYNNITGEGNGGDEHWENRIKALAENASGDCILAKVGEAKSNIPGSEETDLAAADCTGRGNTPKNQGSGTENDTPSYFTYAFEDQDKDGGDYDMNDIVLYCSAPKDGKITVQLVAAGASKDLTVHFKNEQAGTDVALFKGTEVHDLFDVEKKTLVNTGSGPSVELQYEDIQVGEGFSYKDHGDFYIKDNQGRESHVPAFDTQLAERGNVPYGICVPVKWKYPKERCGIVYAYPDFETWAGDMTSNLNWYENGVPANIY